MVSFDDINIEDACKTLLSINLDDESLNGLTAMQLSGIARAVLSLHNEMAADLSLSECDCIRQLGLDRKGIAALADRLYGICREKFEACKTYYLESSLLLNAMFALCSEKAGYPVDSTKSEYCSIAAERIVAEYSKNHSLARRSAENSPDCDTGTSMRQEDSNLMEIQTLISIIHLLAPLGDTACDEPYYSFLIQRLDSETQSSTDPVTTAEKVRLRNLVIGIFG